MSGLEITFQIRAHYHNTSNLGNRSRSLPASPSWRRGWQWQEQLLESTAHNPYQSRVPARFCNLNSALNPFLEYLRKGQITRLGRSNQNFGVSFLCLYLSFPMENKGCNRSNRQADNVVGTQVGKCTHSLPPNSSYDTCHTYGTQMQYDTNWSLDPSIKAGSITVT